MVAAVGTDHPQPAADAVGHDVHRLPHIDDQLAIGSNLRIGGPFQLEHVGRIEAVGRRRRIGLVRMDRKRGERGEQNECSERREQAEAPEMRDRLELRIHSEFCLSGRVRSCPDSPLYGDADI